MIGRTLFWYIFRDLLKIFLMANGALAGIMSFGGLLRPLTHQGLDVGQVGKLLSYFMPAMTTYSLPIAALFATTVVYGRLSADNELTACRSGGLSHLTVALPAFVMGILVAILSLVFLCFIVPAYTLKVEQTLYSNMAKLIAGKIQGAHELRFGPVTIFAQDAYLPPQARHQNGQQMVVLKSPLIETIERPYKNEPDRRVPKDFYTADEAFISIEQRGRGEERGTGKVYLTVHLEDGMKIPRQFQGAVQAGVEATDYGPLEIDSPIKEDTKFMDVWKLKRLYYNPAQGAKVKRVLNELIQRDQQIALVGDAVGQLNGQGEATFHSTNGETYTLTREPGAPYCELHGLGFLIPAAPPIDVLSNWAASRCSADAALAALGLPPVPALPVESASQYRPLTFQQKVAGQTTPVVAAREMQLHVHPSGDPKALRINIELIDSVRRAAGETVDRKSYMKPFNVPMSGAIAAIATRQVQDYTGINSNKADHQWIGREVLQLSNQILAESHSRVSFAISCLVLVMVGCALGMMFRSGNFLSAFAVSFIPALLTITLIVAGQRLSGNVPDDLKTDVSKYANSPLQLGLGLIWTGNCLNFLLAVGLLGRLQKK